PFYGALWGEHIHHGYWEGEESPAAAQEKLVARLAERAGVPRGARVLDVGCGLGGSALWLARHLGWSGPGITISPVAAPMAPARAQNEDVADQVRFLVLDANRLDLPRRASRSSGWSSAASTWQTRHASWRRVPGCCGRAASWPSAPGWRRIARPPSRPGSS